MAEQTTTEYAPDSAWQNEHIAHDESDMVISAAHTEEE